MANNQPGFPGQEYMGHPEPPPWYTFQPSDQTLIETFLIPRIHQQILPPNEIREVNVFNQTPREVARASGYCKQKQEFYFFTDKNLQSLQWKKAPKRAHEITRNLHLIGSKQMLMFKDPTNPNPTVKWYMDEFSAEGQDSSLRVYKLYTGKKEDLALFSDAAVAAAEAAAAEAQNVLNPVVTLPPPIQDFPAQDLHFGGSQNLLNNLVVTLPPPIQDFPAQDLHFGGNVAALWGQFSQQMYQQFQNHLQQQVWYQPQYPPYQQISPAAAQNLYPTAASSLPLVGAQSLDFASPSAARNTYPLSPLIGAQNLNPAAAQNRNIGLPSTSTQANEPQDPAVAQNRNTGFPSTSTQANEPLSQNVDGMDLDIDFDNINHEDVEQEFRNNHTHNN